MNPFFQEVYKGLTAPFKQLSSKYFYDAAGDKIFEEIMDCPEYYLTNCELEVMATQSNGIIDAIQQHHPAFDVIELGPGNAKKSFYFLQEMQRRQVPFTYFPIDISENVIQQLESTLPQQLPGIRIGALPGEYLQMLKKARQLSKRPKLVLFMGANIGNFSPGDAALFIRELRSLLAPGDMLLTGFDLVKDPRIILAAYNDRAGVTKRFNLNLLHRMNRELEANFVLSQFDHFPTYDPQTGTCKSFLVSLQKQEVRLGEADFIHFEEGEPILTENSQKYTLPWIEEMARTSGFTVSRHFFDEKHWFTDSLWRCS